MQGSEVRTPLADPVENLGKLDHGTWVGWDGRAARRISDRWHNRNKLAAAGGGAVSERCGSYSRSICDNVGAKEWWSERRSDVRREEVASTVGKLGNGAPASPAEWG